MLAGSRQSVAVAKGAKVNLCKRVILINRGFGKLEVGASYMGKGFGKLLLLWAVAFFEKGGKSSAAGLVKPVQRFRKGKCVFYFRNKGAVNIKNRAYGSVDGRNTAARIGGEKIVCCREGIAGLAVYGAYSIVSKIKSMTTDKIAGLMCRMKKKKGEGECGCETDEELD